ncbi:MAG: sigma-70 family RNA polymerase sigma factor [Proteobacteria bacterium]|nr:sigma-70 family RNA polymerase sigma factor [Pseudomonadota bacterium]
MSRIGREPQAEVDRRLMMAVKGGDAAALASLYDRHAGAVLAVGLRILGDRAEAEEVLLDVFVQIWKQADRYDAERAAPSTYLLTLARSRALDRGRAIRRRRRLGSEWGEAQSMATEGARVEPRESPLAQVEAAEQRRRVQRAMRELAPAQRHALELAFLDGLSHREIAERLDTPLGTIKSRIRKAMEDLRERLGRIELGSDDE